MEKALIEFKNVRIEIIKEFSGRILLKENDVIQMGVLSKLIEIINGLKLDISIQNKNGNNKNTQQLGKEVIALLNNSSSLRMIKKNEVIEIESKKAKSIKKNKNFNIEMNKEICEAILNYINSFNRLKSLGVLKNQKDFTSQLGEWVASIIYYGEIAVSGKQPDWDLKVNDLKYQIKTHAKATSTNRKNTDFKYKEDADINYLVIIVFDENYKLEKIYKIPFNEAYNLVDRTKKELVIKWSLLERDFSENLDDIYEQNEILKVFKK